MDSFDETYSDSDKRKSKKNKKRDWLAAVSSVQLVLACLGAALLLLILKLSPSTFSSLKTEFDLLMKKDIGVSEAVSVTNLFASGGEDSGIYEATENVCFAPFDTTVDITMPVEGKITSRFGYRYHPITGKFGIHNGTDIAAPEGTPIYAAFNGRVEETGCNSIRGNYILLSHGGETQTLYLHCSEIVAPEGAVVRQGEIIAKVGSTGYSTGPHLHFSVLIGGKYCNPEWLINDI